MKLLVAICSAILTFAAPAAAQNSDHMNPTLMPSLVPMVLGHVTGTSSHTVSVQTIDNEGMKFEIDSRTVMPLQLDPGERVRIEFKLMDSGQHHAQRITPLQPGSRDWELMDQHAMYETDPGGGHSTSQVYAENTAEPAATSRDHQSVEVAETPEPHTEEIRSENMDRADDDGELPATASSLPLALGGGVLLIMTAAGLWMARHYRT